MLRIGYGSQMGKEIYNLWGTGIPGRPKHVKRKKGKNPRVARGERLPYHRGMGPEFYSTEEWRKLRWQVLRESSMCCEACGRGRDHGVILHVDHIVPRSIDGSLELVRSNLQVLCEDCNIGKGASTYRAKSESPAVRKAWRHAAKPGPNPLKAVK